MTRTVYQSFARTVGGTPVPNAAVEIRVASTGLYATIYDSESGGGTITQPGFATGSDGKFVFYAEDGKYDITITSGADSIGFSDVPIGNAQARDAGTDTDQLLIKGDADSLYARYALNNTNATANPSATDDQSAGYSFNSIWFNVTSLEAFKCLDASAGAAIWANSTLDLDDLGSMATVNAGNLDHECRLNSSNNAFFATKNEALDVDINTQTGTAYTVQASDKGKAIVFTSDAAAGLTVPAGLGAKFSFLVVQKGAGAVTFLAAAGVDLDNYLGHEHTTGKDSMVAFISESADNFTFQGATSGTNS